MHEKHELLIDEIRSLREVGEALMERVEDVAASIRYLTNNLLDAEHYPEVGDSLAQLARAASELVSLSPRAPADRSVPPFVRRTTELSDLCADYAQQAMAEPTSDDTFPGEKLGLSPSQAQRLRDALRTLQTQARQLTACQAVGEEAVAEWWGENYEAVFAALWQLDALELEEPDINWERALQAQGGLPAAMEPRNWPEEMSESYWEYAAELEAASNGQQNASGRGEARERQAGLPLVGKSQQAPPAPALTAGESDGQAAESLAVVDAHTPATAVRHERPYTFADFRRFSTRRDSQCVSAQEWQREYAWLRASKKGFIDLLEIEHDATRLKALALHCGVTSAKRQTKHENAEAVYLACLRGFVAGGTISYSPMEESLEQAIDRLVQNLTDEDLADLRTKREERAAERRKALDNPETLLEFHTFIEERGIDQLTDEQHLHRDRLYADLSRATRRDRKPNTVEQFQVADLAELELTVKEGYHEKRDCPVWIVQLGSRVERAAYEELKRKAAQLGGWYSSFKQDQAGFQFLNLESAEKFAGLQAGDADRSDELEGRRIGKLDNVAERFTAMANRLEEQANATLAADEDKLKNTVRRAEQAASARARAREDLATAATLRSLAGQLAEGEATYLDGIRYAVQIETLRCLLRQARRNHIKHLLEKEYGHLSSYNRHVKQDELEQRPVDASDVRSAEYPKPYLYRGHLERAIAQLSNTNGAKQVTAKMRKLVSRTPQGQDFVEFNSECDVALLEDFLGRAKSAGYQCYWFERCLDDYQRLRAANIHDSHELRAALAELLPHLTPPGSDDPVTQAIDKLRGKVLPGFFPTPRPIIHRMLELADIHGDDRVLEPSCGMGDILDAVRERHPEVELQAVELNPTLAEVLAAKGYSEITTFVDFLAYQWRCDKVLLNPPFENSAEIDHVRHAYEQLAVGGRLVSVMSKGPFFRSDAKSREFREWLDGLDHDVEELPEDAFRGVEAFRQTGVRTALVTINKS